MNKCSEMDGSENRVCTYENKIAGVPKNPRSGGHGQQRSRALQSQGLVTHRNDTDADILVTGNLLLEHRLTDFIFANTVRVVEVADCSATVGVFAARYVHSAGIGTDIALAT